MLMVCNSEVFLQVTISRVKGAGNDGLRLRQIDRRDEGW